MGEKSRERRHEGEKEISERFYGQRAEGVDSEVKK